MKARIAVLGGDGIGPEVVAEGLRCLEALGSSFGHEFVLTQLPFGGVAIDAYGDPLPADVADRPDHRLPGRTNIVGGGASHYWREQITDN